MKNSILVVSLLTASFATQAHFYIDYQGVEKVEKTAAELRRERGTPLGMEFLTNTYKGVVFTVGKPIEHNVDGFMDDISVREGLSYIMPAGWLAYVKASDAQHLPDISWTSESESWLQTLAQVGSNFGLKFVVDYDQQLVEVNRDASFVKPDFNVPTIMSDSNGRNVYIYTEKPTEKNGYLMVDGELVPVTVTD